MQRLFPWGISMSWRRNTLVNRLYYAVPKFEEGQFSCSFFYEENTFHKEPNGDLTLVHSKYGIDNPTAFALPANK